MHFYLFIYVARFDVCASCYTNEGPSAIEIKHHKMEHPVVKWTLNPRIGQRQWTDFEANAVLKDLRTDVLIRSEERVGDRTEDSSEDDNDDGEEEEEDENEEEGGKEDEGGVIAAGAAIAAELGLDIDETGNESGEAPSFPDDEAMENLNQDAEETESDIQVKDEADSVDGGEEVVQDPVVPPSPYTCGRCSEGIGLDSTFYRCVGHSCRGALTG
jgi:hypothetical protein